MMVSLRIGGQDLSLGLLLVLEVACEVDGGGGDADGVAPGAHAVHPQASQWTREESQSRPKCEGEESESNREGAESKCEGSAHLLAVAFSPIVIARFSAEVCIPSTLPAGWFPGG
eukprot:2103420-Rhodomonas_salina.1